MEMEIKEEMRKFELNNYNNSPNINLSSGNEITTPKPVEIQKNNNVNKPSTQVLNSSNLNKI